MINWNIPVMKEDDRLIMYLLVRKSLNMSIGKTAAQCGHAVQLLLDKEKELSYNDGIVFRMNRWRSDGAFTKIALAVEDKDWEYIKNTYNPIVVVDAGYTEITSGSETVMALFPMLKSERCNKLKRIRLL